MPAATMKPETLQSLEKEFMVRREDDPRSYRIVKRTIGRIIVTNYDPEVLSNAERRLLHEEAQQNLDDEIIVDIRSGYPGGEYPIHGEFRLRSFSNMVAFLGRAIAEEPEYDVAPDPRSPPTSENPRLTLGITESIAMPWGADRAVKYHGRYYTVTPDTGYQWNRKAFFLLYQLFQMTVVTRRPGRTSPSPSSAHASAAASSHRAPLLRT